MTAQATIESRIPAFDQDGADNPWPDIVRGAVIAGLFFLGLGLWAAVTPLDSAVIAHGQVIVSGNRQAVQHLDGGIVRALHVKEGDTVKEGQVLLELVDSELVSQERAFSSRLIELEAQRARLIAEETDKPVIAPPVRWAGLTDADPALAADVLQRQQAELGARNAAANAQDRVLRQRRQQLEARLPGYDREKDAVIEQVRLLGEEIAGLQTLREKGLTPVSRLRALEREKASLEGRVGQIEAQVAETSEGISEAQGSIVSETARRRAERAAELREAESALADVAPRYEAVVAQLGRTQVRAPASGEVVSLTAFTVGGVIQAGAHVMDIVPSGRLMVIEASVPPENGDDVRLQAKAEVRFPGLGGNSAPRVHGVVSKVSADRIIDQNTGRPYFRVEIAVGEEELASLAASGAASTKEIRPGIPAEVVIPLRKRTALQYLYEPLDRALWRSFRED